MTLAVEETGTWPVALGCALLLGSAVLVAPWRGRRGGAPSSTVGQADPQRAGSAVLTDDTTRPPVTQSEVASALVLLAIAYRSGLPTWQVLSAVAERCPPRAAQDLRQVAAALRWGASETEAWESVPSAWAPAARAVTIAQHAGLAPGRLLTAAADDLHRAELEQLEIAAARVGVRLVAPLGLVLLPAFCLTTVVPLVLALGRQLLGQGGIP